MPTDQPKKVIDDGGPAGPTRGERHPNALRDEWIVRPSEGMSVRMWLAGQAMKGMLANPEFTIRRCINHAMPAPETVKDDAFAYADGRSTTSGNADDLHIAGALHRFHSLSARDEWVDAGYPHRVSSDVGELREAITTRNLPVGHTVRGVNAGFFDHDSDGDFMWMEWSHYYRDVQ